MYYDGQEMLSHNCLLNFIVGNRGGGKTYWFKNYAIKDFLKNKNQFIYLRRYKSELKNIKTFFDDVLNIYPEIKFEVKGNTFYINTEIAGYALPLSISQIFKSNSYPNVTKICFDEFIISQGTYHYLNDEVHAFLDMVETISRTRDVRCYLLSNAISMANPYFIYFNIKMPYNSKFYKQKDLILFELVNNQEYINYKKKTRFGKLIENTEYGNYAIENEFLEDNNNFIEKKTFGSKCLFSFIFENNKLGVWINYSEGKIFVSDDIDPYCKICYSITLNDFQPNTLVIDGLKKTRSFKDFIDNFKLGNVRFENQKIKNCCYKMLKLFIR